MAVAAAVSKTSVNHPTPLIPVGVAVGVGESTGSAAEAKARCEQPTLVALVADAPQSSRPCHTSRPWPRGRIRCAGSHFPSSSPPGGEAQHEAIQQVHDEPPGAMLCDAKHRLSSLIKTLQ